MYSANQHFYLLGHRGARAEFLENCQQGFEYVQCLQQQGNKIDGIEFDVQMTADGKFIVVHDETFYRLSKRQCWVCDSSVDELNTIRQSDIVRFEQSYKQDFLKQKVLQLNDLMPYLQNYQHIELEIKTHARTNQSLLAKNLLRLLSDNNSHNLPITLTSFDTELLYHLQNQQQFSTQKFLTGLLLEPKTILPSQIAFFPMPDKNGDQLIYDSFNLACRLGCVQVGIYYSLITPKLIEIAKRFDLKVTAWTVNDVNVAKKLIEIGVDCIITDYPTLMLGQLI